MMRGLGLLVRFRVFFFLIRYDHFQFQFQFPFFCFFIIFLFDYLAWLSCFCISPRPRVSPPRAYIQPASQPAAQVQLRSLLPCCLAVVFRGYDTTN